MTSTTVDDRGRLYLPKEIREEHGEKYKVVSLESGVKLIPVEEDPVEGLRKAMRGAEDIDISEISEKAQEGLKEELKEEFE